VRTNERIALIYYYSRHAKRQMKWRQIAEDEVRTTVTSPDYLQETIKERKNAVKKIGEKLIQVTYRLEHDQIVIVTVIDKKQLGGQNENRI